MIRANLLHLSYNMWSDTPPPADCPEDRREIHFSPSLQFDDALWRECLEAMAEAGMNMVVIDVGDGVCYETRPEIVCEGAWAPGRLRDELAFCRGLGIEPVPKLNFSACHDAWFGVYSRMLSTPRYYDACRDLINEVCELFDGPRLFHIGMDEETWEHQKGMLYAVVRQGALWWHDLNHLIACVERAGSRAWMWSDVLWHCEPDAFRRNVPLSVLQSNWYYGAQFPDDRGMVAASDRLEQWGYEQVPTGSTWSCRENYGRLVQYFRERIAPERLLGFMMADWRPTTPRWREAHLDAIRVAEEAHHGD